MPVSAELCLEFLEHVIHECADDGDADDPAERELAEILPAVKVDDEDDGCCADEERYWHDAAKYAFVVMVLECASLLLLCHADLCGPIDFIGPLFW